MGCATSKQSNKKRCKHCQAPYSPVTRSYSMHVIHPPQHKSDSYHLVALTSTTLGSLKLEPPANDGGEVGVGGVGNDDGLLEMKKSREEFAMSLIEAKTWSKMIQEKIPRPANSHPKTPIMTPPGEPETINTWELMEGLEEDRFTSPCRLPNHIRSFSFDVSRDAAANMAVDSPKLVSSTHSKVAPIEETEAESEAESEEANHKKKPPPAAKEDYFDPNIISMFRKSMQELSPSHPYHLKKQGKEEEEEVVKDRVVVYFTSLRGVRKTYEESCYVRVILKGLGVRVDERDVSMHSGFKDELKQLLGGISLPRVFIGKKYIGGAEEVRRLHEEGQLEKAVEGCEKAAAAGDGGGGGGSCEACGDIRFVPCETCCGSCKIYYEEEEEDDEAEEEEEEEEEEDGSGDYGFQRCPDCNENGLIRCPICCY